MDFMATYICEALCCPLTSHFRALKVRYRQGRDMSREEHLSQRNTLWVLDAKGDIIQDGLREQHRLLADYGHLQIVSISM